MSLILVKWVLDCALKENKAKQTKKPKSKRNREGPHAKNGMKPSWSTQDSYHKELE